jgi:hypothetical protein
MPLAGICAGGGPQGPFLPRPYTVQRAAQRTGPTRRSTAEDERESLRGMPLHHLASV